MGILEGRRIAVLAGGHPSEHEVSLESGDALIQALLQGGALVVPVLVHAGGEWSVLPEVSRASQHSWEGFPSTAGRTGAGRPAPVAASALLEMGVEAVLLGLHGLLGEDGTMQGFLEISGFPHGGSNVRASALGADKAALKRLLLAEDLPTPGFMELEGDAFDQHPEDPADRAREILETFTLPLVLKPRGLGSSVGIQVVQEAEDLPAALLQTVSLGDGVLIEEHVTGREFTCAVIGPAGCPASFPVIEIVPRKAAWFDPRCKYEEGGALEIVPADIDPRIEHELRALATRVHTLIGAAGATRTDFILDVEDRPWILEINTLPGRTSASLLPKAVAAAGWSPVDLVEALLEGVLGTGEE